MLSKLILVAFCAPLYAFSTLSATMRVGGKAGVSVFAFSLVVSLASLTMSVTASGSGYEEEGDDPSADSPPTQAELNLLKEFEATGMKTSFDVPKDKIDGLRKLITNNYNDHAEELIKLLKPASALSLIIISRMDIEAEYKTLLEGLLKGSITVTAEQKRVLVNYIEDSIEDEQAKKLEKEIIAPVKLTEQLIDTLGLSPEDVVLLKKILGNEKIAVTFSKKDEFHKLLKKKSLRRRRDRKTPETDSS